MTCAGACTSYIYSSTFIDMKEASALFRLLGDEARLRLLRVLARDRFNVTELTGILGLAQSGVSRHLGLLKEAGLVSEERDGAYSYYRLAPAVRDATARSALAAARVAVRGRPRRRRAASRRSAAAGGAAGAARELRPACRPRHARRPAAGAGPELGGVGAGARPPAAAGRRRGHRLRRRLSDRRGRALGAPRRRRRSIAGGAGARQGARRAPARDQHHVQARRARSPAARDGVDGRRAAVARRCITRRIRRTPWPRPRASCGLAAKCSCSTCARTTKTWVRDKLGDRQLGFGDDALDGC